MITLTTIPTIGSFVEGYTVTDVVGKKVFGMKGEHKYTPEPHVPGEFYFRPGCRFALINKNGK